MWRAGWDGRDPDPAKLAGGSADLAGRIGLCGSLAKALPRYCGWHAGCNPTCMLTLSPLAASGATLIPGLGRPGLGQPGAGQDAVDPTAAAGFLAALLQHGLALAAPPTALQPDGGGTAAVGPVGAATPQPLQTSGLPGQTTGVTVTGPLVPGMASASAETIATSAPSETAAASTPAKTVAAGIPVEMVSPSASPEGLSLAGPATMRAIAAAKPYTGPSGSTPPTPASAEAVKQAPGPIVGTDAKGRIKPSEAAQVPAATSAIDAAPAPASAMRMPAALRGLIDVQSVPGQTAPETPPATAPSPTVSAAAGLASPAAAPAQISSKLTTTTDQGRVETGDDAAAADPSVAAGKSADVTVATAGAKAISPKTRDSSEPSISSPSPTPGNTAPAATPPAPGQGHLEAPAKAPEARVATVPATPVAVANEIVRTVHHGADRLQLDLMPESLGRVRVEVAVDDNGRVRAAFAVDRPETLQLLQRDTRGLTQALSAAGMPVADGGLSFSLRQDGGGNNNAQAAWQQRALPFQNDDTPARPGQPSPSPRTRAVGVGQLDLTV